MADAGSVRHRRRHREREPAVGRWNGPGLGDGAPAGWGLETPLPTSILALSQSTPCSEWEDTSVSSLWTPSGEHEPASSAGEPAVPGGAGPGPGGPDGGDVDEAAVREELRRVRAELAGTPVADLVANHAIGLWQLAVLHLTPDEDAPIRLDEAGLAIDAMAALVEQLGDRLGESAEPLRDALAQLRIAYVQISEGSGTAPEDV